MDLDGRPVVLFGDNGAGKTNLLEAVSFLAPGRGLRRAKMEDIPRKENHVIAPAWGVTAALATRPDAIKIAVGSVPEYPKRRTVRIDGKNATSSQLATHVKMMWLTPAQDRLFTGPASDRRKFLDRFSIAHQPDHGMTSLRYEKLRTERNRLLSDGVTDAGWYDALEADMAVHGAKIAQARAMTVRKLVEDIDARPEGTFPKAVIELDGDAEDLIANGMPVDEVEATLREQLADKRHLHIRAGRTLDGVHRSDLRVTYAAKNMAAADCSTGEQKALLIGLILAHARTQSHDSVKPILLLDEVAAHLDENRRTALAQELLELKLQVFMTGTDTTLFTAFDSHAQMFAAANGKLIPA